ncbi:amidohydrolase family protein [Candidatus Dojkabacteria bacterium]|nr:amidohydrolase family protein [Candidatus Dojkabacteria bacterium]
MKLSKYFLIAFVITFSVVILFGTGSLTAKDKDKRIPKCDIVIKDGRVMDPLTGYDNCATVGIKNGKIVAITKKKGWSKALSAQADKVVDASGLVVAPGFINTHTHEGMIEESMKVFVRDGITSWIGGNCGSSYYPLSDYFDEMESNGMYNNYGSLTGLNTLRSLEGLDVFTPANSEQLASMVYHLAQDLQNGGFGVSFGSYYGPGCTYEEMLATAQESVSAGGMAASHIRDNLFNADGIGMGDYIVNAEALDEAIQTSRETGIPYIISHLTDVTYGTGTTGYALGVISEAIYGEGLRLAVDVIGSDSFPNNFFTILRYGTVPIPYLLGLSGAQITDFQVTEDVIIDGGVYMEAYEYFSSIDQAQTIMDAILAGETTSPGVLCHIIKPANTLLALAEPFVFIGNDGSVRKNPSTGELEGHPRAAGAFARFLGHWVRDHDLMNLMEALYKTSAAPALWLGLQEKGRLQIGCDADIVVFDPDTIIDTATTTPGNMLSPPEGIYYVLVNGALVVEDGILTDEKPGRVIRRNWSIPGIIYEMPN